MLINLFIILVLVWAFMVGYSRGLITQAFYSIGTIVAIIVAISGYKSLAGTISSWIPFSSPTASAKLLLFNNDLLFHVDDAYYAGLAFLIIYTITYAIFRVIGIFLKFKKNAYGKSGKLIAAALSLISSYFGLAMIFTTLSLVPMATVQNYMSGSGLVRLMVLYTPISTQLLSQLFIENITKINPFK